MPWPGSWHAPPGCGVNSHRHKHWQLLQVDIVQGQLSQLYQRRQGSRQVTGVKVVAFAAIGDAQAGKRGKVAHTVWNPCWLRVVPVKIEIETAQRWKAAGDNGVDGLLAGQRIQAHR